MRYYVLDDLVDPETAGTLTVRNAVVVERPGPTVPRCLNWCGYRGTVPSGVPDADCAACQQQAIVKGDLVSAAHEYRIVGSVPRMIADGAAVDRRTQESFGYEWQRFAEVLPDYTEEADNYFHVVPDDVTRDAVVLDAGCGMGRWARYAAGLPIRRLYAIDFSAAVDRAAAVLDSIEHAHPVQADVTRLPFRRETFDFAYCLGVLHHLEDPDAGMRAIAGAVKPNGALLVYLYYALDNRPSLYRWLFRAVRVVRRLTVRLPKPVMGRLAAIIGTLVYWPVARMAGAFERVGLRRLATAMPLAHYRRYSLRFMITDAFDRFATPIERRYTRADIRAWLARYGFDATFSVRTPHWVVFGRRAH